MLTQLPIWYTPYRKLATNWRGCLRRGKWNPQDHSPKIQSCVWVAVYDYWCGLQRAHLLSGGGGKYVNMCSMCSLNKHVLNLSYILLPCCVTWPLLADEETALWRHSQLPTVRRIYTGDRVPYSCYRKQDGGQVGFWRRNGCKKHQPRGYAGI